MRATSNGARIVSIRSTPPDLPHKKFQSARVLPPAASWDNSRSGGIEPALTLALERESSELLAILTTMVNKTKDKNRK